MRLISLCFATVALVACSRGAEPTQPAEPTEPADPIQGMWRDQYIFLGDDGILFALVAKRNSPDDVEIKGWMGQKDRWVTNFYHRGKANQSLRDVEEVLSQWSRRPGSPLRIGLERDEKTLALHFRSREMRARLDSQQLNEIGRFEDPEGLSVYSAGRTTLELASREKAEGWLIVESTLPERPRKTNADYGTFVFTVLASSQELHLAKASSNAGFNYGLMHQSSTSSSTQETKAIKLSASHQEVQLSRPDLARELVLPVRDRITSELPTGIYDVLLLGDEERVGVAFTIRR